ncbi:hypothetical protein D0962_18840 [Leptolyngbyaceae cyanobacterium CCMR0082]|uniref:Uncharacterized protein n=1 Tax=Adonisia turfae CCMR0082 TaxID=2304604 RepID=A0A6M0S8L3_9CYAN|nr:hypothetical protein [Adonisia turfae]NEZ64818.1 hypothetical protein [Adonisia turfae CCMR0082]
MNQLVRQVPDDFSQQLTMISIFQRFDPAGFHGRLCRWCEATGFEVKPDWNTHAILTMLDDERVLKLGAVLRKTFFKEVREMAKPTPKPDVT